MKSSGNEESLIFLDSRVFFMSIITHIFSYLHCILYKFQNNVHSCTILLCTAKNHFKSFHIKLTIKYHAVYIFVRPFTDIYSILNVCLCKDQAVGETWYEKDLSFLI